MTIKNSIKNTKFENNSYMVGGIIRDAIMGNENDDIDIVVSLNGGGIDLAKYLYENGVLEKDPLIYTRFGTAFSYIGDLKIEFVETRSEEYNEDSRNPSTQYSDLKSDVFRRDFTINSLLYNISNGELLDLTNKGIDDIANKIIRTTNNPYLIFSQDPLRMLRAIRFSARFGFEMDIEQKVVIPNLIERLDIISKERIHDEIVKIFDNENYNTAIQLMWDNGILEYLFPSIKNINRFFYPFKGSHPNKYTYLQVLSFLLSKYYDNNFGKFENYLIKLKFSNYDISYIKAYSYITNAVKKEGCNNEILFRKLSHLFGAEITKSVLLHFLDVIGYDRSSISNIIEMVSCVDIKIKGSDLINKYTFSNKQHIGIVYHYLIELTIANPMMSVNELFDFAYSKKIELEYFQNVTKKNNRKVMIMELGNEQNKGLIDATLLVKSRRINDGYDWIHVAFLLNSDTVVYTQTNLTNGILGWNVQSLEDYKFDFKNSFYNNERYIEYVNRSIVNG